MKKVLIAACSLLLAILSCSKEFPLQPRPNQPPRTFLWLFPDSTIAQGVSKQRIHWWGEDPDGIVAGFLFSVARIAPPVAGIPNPDTLTWTWTTRNDTLFSFPLLTLRDTFTVFVRAVDNTLGILLPEQSHIRFFPTPYWDRNDNGVYDSTTDQTLPAMLAAADMRGANQWMPLRNQPPSVAFAPDPSDPTRTIRQPETTFTAATFAWVGSDPDGDETITEYRIALNNPSDSTRWVSLPGNIMQISLYVPRARSDGSSGEVTADVYSGNFLGRRLTRTLPGLKLDSLNTFYVQAKDIAGEYSPIIRMPQPPATWFVRKPRSKLLAVIDYIASDSTVAENFYRNAFSQVVLPGGSLGNYDEINIGRGISATDKQNSAAGIGNPQFGVLVPRLLDPAFIYTLFLFDYVFWYTDQFPSLPVAAFSLFYYKTGTFDGRSGKVIFSTTFGTSPDPRGVLRYFAPIDSVSSVDLGTSHLLPSLGDSRIPGGFVLPPDSSVPSNIYPPLMFNTGVPFHSIFMRPIYRQPDGRYIYRMQEDTRTPIRYTYVSTTSDLRSVSISGGAAHAVGVNGTILASSDVGNSWVVQRSGPGSLRSAHFSDASQGWSVGDSGTILITNNGGLSWTNRSIVTVQNLLGVHFLDAQNGLVVGTKGLIIKSTDGGVTWISLNSGTILPLRGVRYLDLNNAVAVGDSLTILKTTDGGMLWRNRRPAGIPGALLGRKLLCVNFSGSTAGYAVGEGGIYMRSTDGGENWTLQTSFATTSTELRSVYFADQLTGWTVGWSNAPPPGAGIIFRTVDGGSSWSQLFTGGTTQNLNGVAFQTDGQGIVVGSGGIILKALNGGAAASDWSFQPKGPINVGVIDGSKRFVVLGLPLHLLDGSGTVKDFLRHVILDEFGP